MCTVSRPIETAADATPRPLAVSPSFICKIDLPFLPSYRPSTPLMGIVAVVTAAVMAKKESSETPCFLIRGPEVKNVSFLMLMHGIVNGVDDVPDLLDFSRQFNLHERTTIWLLGVNAGQVSYYLRWMVATCNFDSPI